MNVCLYSKDYHEIVLKGKFILGKDSYFEFDRFASRWYYEIKLSKD